jgi:hypothetical protein
MWQPPPSAATAMAAAATAMAAAAVERIRFSPLARLLCCNIRVLRTSISAVSCYD